jgi:hypothetical protein
MIGAQPSTTLWLTPRPRPVTGEDVTVVLDSAWTPDAVAAAGERQVLARDVMDEVLQRFDPIVETSALLDSWAVRSDVVTALTIGGTSFWYYMRLRHWLWLQERVLWAQILRRLLDDHTPASVACAAGADQALVDVARLMTAANGIELRVEGDLVAGDATALGDGVMVDDLVARRAIAAPTSVAAPRSRPLWRRILGRLGRIRDRLRSGAAHPSLAFVEERLARLVAEDEPRLLVVLSHHAHRVDTPTGPRMMNPYLGSVADRLVGTRLDPIMVDWRVRLADSGAMARLLAPGAERILPRDVIRLGDEPLAEDIAERAVKVAQDFAEVREPVITAGIDLGPSLSRDVGEAALTWFPAKHVATARFRRLIERLGARAVLVADEYHRQDWMEAAALAGVPVAAIQHGTIYRHHRGYMHADRPPALRLPARTYVFGGWERDLLVRDSVYREDEVVVGGSPRLDMFHASDVDRDAVRAACGVAPDDRLLVLSGTYGGIYRRFHYPVILARLFDRHLPGVHVVVKQHPAEDDEGPYRAVIECVAAARGFAPPPITVVKHVDLYRLLAAADAHLGIHSTVLTEAVFVGTPNLLATCALGGDLLDYVAAGVALPVNSGAELLTALEAASAGVIAPEARAAFIARHFEPGSATERISDDLLAWLDPTVPAMTAP